MYSYSYRPGFGLFSLVYWALIFFGLWGIFKKAGKPGWPAIIPFYNFSVLMQVIGWPGLWTLALLAGLVPFIGWLGLLILHIFVAIDVGKSSG